MNKLSSLGLATALTLASTAQANAAERIDRVPAKPGRAVTESPQSKDEKTEKVVPDFIFGFNTGLTLALGDSAELGFKYDRTCLDAEQGVVDGSFGIKLGKPVTAGVDVQAAVHDDEKRDIGVGPFITIATDELEFGAKVIGRTSDHAADENTSKILSYDVYGGMRVDGSDVIVGPKFNGFTHRNDSTRNFGAYAALDLFGENHVRLEADAFGSAVKTSATEEKSAVDLNAFQLNLGIQAKF